MSRQPAADQPSASSRQRLLDAALNMLSSQGYAASAIKDIARAGGAPMGSVYYYFPGGKEELGAAAMRHGAQRVADSLRHALDSHDDVAEALAAWLRNDADELEQASWNDGCPVATTALETVGRSQVLQHAAADAFTEWRKLIDSRLRRSGLSAAAADRLATTAIALLEGAEILARVHGSRKPLDHAAHSIRALIRAALPR